MVNYGPAKTDPTGGNPNGVGNANGNGNGGSVTGNYHATPPDPDPLVARWNELVNMVFGPGGTADPNSMYKLAANVAVLQQFKLVHADHQVYDAFNALAGPDGSWKGAASEAFGRVAFAITDHMAKTTAAISNPKQNGLLNGAIHAYDELLNGAGYAHAQAMVDIHGIIAKHSYRLPPVISKNETKGEERFDYVSANAEAEQVVKTLGEAYTSRSGLFNVVPATPNFQKAPPPPIPIPVPPPLPEQKLPDPPALDPQKLDLPPGAGDGGNAPGAPGVPNIPGGPGAPGVPGLPNVPGGGPGGALIDGPGAVGGPGTVAGGLPPPDLPPLPGGGPGAGIPVFGVPLGPDGLPLPGTLADKIPGLQPFDPTGGKPVDPFQPPPFVPPIPLHAGLDLNPAPPPTLPSTPALAGGGPGTARLPGPSAFGENLPTVPGIGGAALPGGNLVGGPGSTLVPGVPVGGSLVGGARGPAVPEGLAAQFGASAGPQTALGERALGAPTAGGGAGMSPGMYPPMMGAGGMGYGDQKERERETWLLENDEVWDSGELPTGVLGRACDPD